MRAVLLKRDVAGCIAGRRLAGGMQGPEKGHQSCGFRRAQVFSVSWHVASALNHLPDQLVLREPYRNAVERRTSLPAEFAERMAIAALLGLKHQRPLPLKRRGSVQKSFRNRIAAPSIHVRAPGSKSGEM